MLNQQASSSAIEGAHNSEVIENPISIDVIEPYLYIGNATAASDMRKLNELNINHILTIDSCPLPNSIRNNPKIINKFIKANDVPKEDLLQHFDVCLEFINEAINNQKNVLVHCYYGVSRSATIVIAYIMKKYKIKYDKAYERVKLKRILIGPNHGFIQQLRLFHRMGFQIDKKDDKYKIYRLRLAADKIQKAKRLPCDFSDLIKPDPAIAQEVPDPVVFRCMRCRRVLANNSNLILHTAPSKLDQITQKVNLTSINENSESERSQESKTILCTEAYFFEPITWMHNITQHTQGNLNCPKCNAKVGKFNWVMSTKCPCGKQIQPAIYLSKSKIEKSNMVQNVQVTI